MTHRIAILGWGSLIWDKCPEFDEQHEAWQLGTGPEIKLEFSRISATSRAGALTLVIDPTCGTPCRVAYALSKRRTVDDAICDLRCREGTTLRNIGFVFADRSRSSGRDPATTETVCKWMKVEGLDAVVWTDLETNFEDMRREPFSVDAALRYIQQSLDAEGKATAAEYVWRAPPFVNTPLRAAPETAPWFPPAPNMSK